MRTASSLLVFAAAWSVGCIFPDTDIEVYAVQECGTQYRASTNGASGISGNGDVVIILINGTPITQTWCLTPEESELMAFEQSWIYQQIHDDIVAACKARAIELSLGNQTCSQHATIASSGVCPGKHEWCDAEASDDEVGAPDLPPE